MKLQPPFYQFKCDLTAKAYNLTQHFKSHVFFSGVGGTPKELKSQRMNIGFTLVRSPETQQQMNANFAPRLLQM